MPTILYNKQSEKEKRRSLRKIQPQPEIILWSKLRSRQIQGYKFRRQYSIGAYVLDFYCPRARLAVEIDGESHFTESGKYHDMERSRYLGSVGIQILRFTNREVIQNITVVLERIHSVLTSPNPSLTRRG